MWLSCLLQDQHSALIALHSGSKFVTKESTSSHRLYVYRVYSKGFDRTKKRNPEEKFIKIGLTSQTNISDRFTKFPDGMEEHYSRSLMTSQKFSTRAHLFDVEQSIHAALKKFKYVPKNRFSGWTECYVNTEASRKAIKAILWAARLKHTPNTKVVKQISERTRKKALRVIDQV